MKVYGFPGQGSQFRGMGKGLFEKFPHLTQKANDILGYSLSDLCTENPQNLLFSTQYTQPALYVVNVLTYLQRLKESPKPNYLIGHSLGEYCALFAAGAFEFEDGLRMVKKRGALMSSISGGGMAASIDSDISVVQRELDEHRLYELDIANFNSPKQIVLSGPTSEIFEQSMKMAKNLASKSRLALTTLKRHLNKEILRELPGYIKEELLMHQETLYQPSVLSKIKNSYI